MAPVSLDIALDSHSSTNQPGVSPAVSVVIPLYNAQKWISETLKSVIAQTYEGKEIEIIIVDDGSTDNSVAAAEMVLVGTSLAHRIIRTSNGGPSRARNLGTKLARGKFLQYLDADDLLAPGKLRLQIAALNQSGADVAYGDWQRLELDRSGRHAPADMVVRHMEEDPEIELFTDFWCPPAAYLFRRTIVERVGGWNEGLPVIQDARFTLDCALHRRQFVYCPGIVAWYREHRSDSVSTRSSVAFTRDVYNNAVQVETWWQQYGTLSDERRTALLRVYSQVARASYTPDPEIFEAAFQALERLRPGYIPTTPRHLALASRLIGYRQAEALALHYRQGKYWLRGIIGKR